MNSATRTRFVMPALALGILLIAAALTACGDSEGSAPQSTPVGSSPGRSDSTDSMSLDGYIAWCSEREEPELDDQNATYEEVSIFYGELIETMESVSPPAEVADWHNKALAGWKTVKKTLDAEPEDAIVDPFILFADSEVMSRFEEVGDALNDMSASARERLASAGCLGDESDAGTSGAGDSGEAITVGESVEAEIDGPGDADTYSFQAEQGERYLIEVVRGTLPDFYIALPVPEGAIPSNFAVTDGEQQFSRRWQARTSGAHSFHVFGEGVGSYTLTLRLDTSLIGPSNERWTRELSAIRVSWDAVDGADYYNVYYSDFFDAGCRFSGLIDGILSFCEELATNVVGTTYIHTSPDADKNHYWVVACNSGGCSRIDSGNPAEDASPEDASPYTSLIGPSNERWIRENSAIRVSWDAVDGSDYYKVYHDDLTDDACDFSEISGMLVFCEELATDVVGTTYVHTSPDADENYYWVVACNSGGCSDIDSRNPAEDASPSTTAPAVTPSPGQSGPSTVVPIAIPTQTPPESDMSRKPFEASTPSGYTRVSLTDRGRVWGTPDRFTTDSSLGAVAYMLLGTMKGCSFADEELNRSSVVYAKIERLGDLSKYEAQEVCRMAGSAWETAWDGLRITHLRIFDESSSTNTREYVYDADGMQYIESLAASGGSN